MKRTEGDLTGSVPVLPDTELKALIRLVGNGDVRAMERLYRLCQARVYRFAKSRLNDSFAAADVLHETMIEIWKCANRFQARSQGMTWILGIANHKVMDQLRQQYRHAAEELDEDRPDVEAATPHNLVELALTGEKMRNCLLRLSEKHRAVLHLAFYEDMSYGDIAKVVGCPEGTVKTRVFHAKEALKKCLLQTTA